MVGNGRIGDPSQPIGPDEPMVNRSLQDAGGAPGGPWGHRGDAEATYRLADRRKVVAALNAGHVKVLVATGQLIGEGFDCRELSTLFLATAIRFNGRLLQYLGRVLRPAPGKVKATVYDYLDINVPVLEAAARARLGVYGLQGE